MTEQTRYAKGACESCGGHIEYPLELGGSTVECPHCHFPTPLPSPAGSKPPKPSLGVTAALTMLILVTAIGYGTWRIHLKESLIAPAPPSLPPATNIIPAPPPAPVARVWNGLQGGPVALQKSGDGDLVYAVGKLTNISDQQKFGVKVRVDLFGENGDKIGSATDYAASIDAGKEWQFRALVVDRGAVKAELKEVTEN